nr:putative ribonuclease H-like domain-containing protein [Tanacetum cinerariifolium]
TTSASKKMSYGDSLSYSSTTTYTAPSNSKIGCHRSGNVIKDVLYSFVADTEPEHQLAYEDFKQIEKLDMEEMDLKWQLTMLSVQQEEGQMLQVSTKRPLCQRMQGKGGNDEQRYSSFKIKEIGKKEEDSKALITVDTLVDWTYHDGESDGVIASKEFGMIAGCDTADAIKEGAAKIYNLITGADTEEASTTADSMKVVPPPLSEDYTSLSDHIDLDESQMSYGTKSSTSSDSKTGKVNIPPARPQLVPTGKPKVFAPAPTGRQNRPFPVPTDRGYSPSVISGWWKRIDGQLLLSPQQVVLGHHIEKENPFPYAEDKEVFDSGCSRSMTGNKERLDDFQVFQGGKVTFRGGEGRITGKGTIRTRRLDFENVYYVKKLQQFNLFSISQICDKKNRVLFIDTECLVLSKDFNLPDESMVVLRVPRKHNLYTINLNNLCPMGNLACLVANASVDESVKWHKRMGHVNYKNMNRLVKGNLVRGLPPKLFKNDHTCVACYKGKQYKAFYKAINVVSSTSEPLQLLHMDLFGPTSIRSIDHKYYCLVITDDYSSHFKSFGCHVTILNTSDHLGKFDGKTDKGYIVGYSASNKAYRVIQGTEPKDTSCDEVDDSHLISADKIFQKELARLKGQEQRANSDAERLSLGFTNDSDELQKRTSAKTVPPGSIPVPTGSIPVPTGDTMVSTDDVPVHTSSPTDSFFDDEPTTRFPGPSDLGNHDPSPGIFSSSSYDDEFGTALNNVASTVVVSPVATKRINTIHPQSLIIRDHTSAVQTRSKMDVKSVFLYERIDEE